MRATERLNGLEQQTERFEAVFHGIPGAWALILDGKNMEKHVISCMISYATCLFADRGYYLCNSILVFVTCVHAIGQEGRVCDIECFLVAGI